MKMQSIKKYLYKIALLTYAFSLPIVSFAQTGGNSPTGGNAGCDKTKQICNPINESTINGLIKTVLEGVLRIGFPIIALAIIYCGFLFVSARGKPEAITKAKDALLYTLIGAAVLLGSWAIAQLISNTVLAL